MIYGIYYIFQYKEERERERERDVYIYIYISHIVALVVSKFKEYIV